MKTANAHVRVRTISSRIGNRLVVAGQKRNSRHITLLGRAVLVPSWVIREKLEEQGRCAECGYSWDSCICK